MFDALLFDPVAYGKDFKELSIHLREMTKEEKDKCQSQLKYWITIYAGFSPGYWENTGVPYQKPYRMISRAYIQSNSFIPSDFKWKIIKPGLWGGELKDGTKRT